MFRSTSPDSFDFLPSLENITVDIPSRIFNISGFCFLISWLVIVLPNKSAKAIILADVFLLRVGLPSITSISSSNSDSFIFGFFTCVRNPAFVLALASRLVYNASNTVLGTPVALPSASKPWGKASITSLAFLLNQRWALATSAAVKLALLLILAGDIPNSSPTVFIAALGTLLKLVNASTSTSAFTTSDSTLSVTLSWSANTFNFVRLSGCCSTASSAATPLASVTSSVNSSPKTLREASIALAGKNLFIYAANGTPDSGLYFCIRSNIPLSPVFISSVSSCLSKLGASDLFCTILFTIGANWSIMSIAPLTPSSWYICWTLSEASLEVFKPSTAPSPFIAVATLEARDPLCILLL